MSSWMQAIALGILSEPVAEEIVRATRERFGLAEPADRTDVALNRRASRPEVRAHIAQACAEASWGDDGPEALVPLLFHPELFGELFRMTPEALGRRLTPKERLANNAMVKAVGEAFEATAVPRLFRECLIDLVTDHTIAGSLSPPSDMPNWFSGNVFTCPLYGDRVIVLLASRFSDLPDLVARLSAEHARSFRTRQREKPRPALERDLWVMSEYGRAKATVPDTSDATLYDTLLTRFEVSPWRKELRRYDLNTKEGQAKAKRFLRQIVFRMRRRAGAVIDALPYDAGDD